MNILLKYFIYFLLGIIIYYCLFNSPNVGSKKLIEGFDYSTEYSSIIPDLYVKSGYNADTENIVNIQGDPIADDIINSATLSESLISMRFLVNANPSPLGISRMSSKKTESYFPKTLEISSGVTDTADSVIYNERDFYSLKLKKNPTAPILKMIVIDGGLSESNFNTQISEFSGAEGMEIQDEPTTLTIITEANRIIDADNTARVSDTHPSISTDAAGAPLYDDLMVFGDVNNAIIIELIRDAAAEAAAAAAGGAAAAGPEFVGSALNIYIMLSAGTSGTPLPSSNMISVDGSKNIIGIRTTRTYELINVFNDSKIFLRLNDTKHLVIGLSNLTFNTDPPITTNILVPITTGTYTFTNGEIGDGIDYFTGQELLHNFLVNTDTTNFGDLKGASLVMMTAFASTNADGSVQKSSGCESSPEGLEQRCLSYDSSGRYRPQTNLEISGRNNCNAQDKHSIEAGQSAFGIQACNSDIDNRGFGDRCCEDRRCEALFVDNPTMCGDEDNTRMRIYNANCPPNPIPDDGDQTHCQPYCCGIQIHSYLETLFNGIINFNNSRGIIITDRKINHNHIRNYIYGNLLDLDHYDGFITDRGNEFFDALDTFIHLGTNETTSLSTLTTRLQVIKGIRIIPITPGPDIVKLNFALCASDGDGASDDMETCGTASAPINKTYCSPVNSVCKSPLQMLKETIKITGQDELHHIKLNRDISSNGDFNGTLNNTIDNTRGTSGTDDLDTILNQGQRNNYNSIANSYKNFINRYIQGNQLETLGDSYPINNSLFIDNIKESIFALTIKFSFHGKQEKSPLESSYPMTQGFLTMDFTQFVEII